MENIDKTAYELPVQKRSTIKFIIFYIITVGFYIYWWLWYAVKDLNALQTDGKKLSFWPYAICFMISDGLGIYSAINEAVSKAYHFETISQVLYIIAAIALCIAIAYRLQDYAREAHGVNIKHSAIALLFFGFIYGNFMLNSFSERVANAIQENRVIGRHTSTAE